jgi:general secretion pathway protein L
MSLADAFKPTLSRLQARYAASPMPRFLTWWLGELRGFLPLRWRERLSVQEAELHLQLDGDELLVGRALGGRVSDLARLPLAPAGDLLVRFERAIGDNLGGLRRILLLEPSQVLRRRLQLPAVARERLRTMLAFELDRQTPFRAEQVHFDARILPQTDPRQLPVELALVPREVLQHTLTRLGPLAGALDAADVADGGVGGQRLGCNFLPAERRRARSSRGLWINLGLVAASLLLLFLAMGQLVENRQQAVVELQAELERQRSAARGVTQLRSTLDEAVAAANFLAVQKQQQPSILELLTSLTTVLPDDTHLDRLTVSREVVNMSGQSGRAAQLIEYLQRAEHIENPSLVGAIQPDPRTGKDRFNISAQMSGQAEEGR